MSQDTVQSILSQSPVSFGTSGLRGLVSDLTMTVCRAATAGFLDHGAQSHGLKPGTEVLIAHDLRPSSPQIAKAVIAAVKDADMVPVFCGKIPTPALALAGAIHSLPAIMITGSHIPFDRNGIKFYYQDGEMSKADEAPILSSQKILSLNPDIAELPTAVEWPADLYFKRFVSGFAGLLEGQRIGHFQHSAVGRDITAQILKALGAEVIVLERTTDFVPIDTEAVSKADREKAKAWSREHKLDFIFSTDGDGDRPLLADENGTYLQGDVLGVLAASYLGAKTVVTPVSSNTIVEQTQWFSKVIRTKIGSPHVIASMAGQNSVVGYEANGGLLTGSDFVLPNGVNIPALPTRDALLPALATLALAKRESKTLAGLVSGLPKRFTCSDRIENWPTENSSNLVAELTSNTNLRSNLMAPFGQVDGVDNKDGLRMTLEDGNIVHLRPSGNAPEFRVYVEASSPELAANLLDQVLNMLREKKPATQ